MFDRFSLAVKVTWMTFLVPCLVVFLLPSRGLFRAVFTPTVYTVGCILSPLRGWSIAAYCSVFRRTFSALEATTGERLRAGYYFVGSVGQDEVDSAGLVGLQGFGEIEGG